MTARVQSTIGNSSHKGKQRNYVVSDETLGERPNPNVERPRQQQITPAMAAELRQQAADREHLAQNRAMQEARRRVEIITGLGRKTKDVVVDTDQGKLTFTLRSLKSFEQEALSQVMESVDRIPLPNGNISFTPTGMHKIKMEALGHSLHLIDGQSVDVVLATVNEDYEEQVEARKDLLREMDAALVDHLFVQYERLASETSDGYMPRNDRELKEVVEDIRKSGEDTGAPVHQTPDEPVRETT